MAHFNHTITPKTIRRIVAGFGFLVIVCLTLYQLRFYIGGPEIIIDQRNLNVSQSRVQINFMVENTVAVTLAGRPVIPQVTGLVQEYIYVVPGRNVLEIQAQDKYGSVQNDYLYITYPQ